LQIQLGTDVIAAKLINTSALELWITGSNDLRDQDISEKDEEKSQNE
jgi:hypothetical protein